MDTKIKKMRERLVKHQQKIAELETQSAEMEREIKKAEDEQVCYLARSAANSLSASMDEIIEVLRSLQPKPANHQNSYENKEGETVDDIYKTGSTDESEI